MIICSGSVGLLHIFVVISPGFLFCFLSTGQEIDWEEHLRNDLFSVECGVKPQLNSNEAPITLHCLSRGSVLK